MTTETDQIENDERLQSAVEATKETWLPVIRFAYGIPAVVSEPIALAAISADIQSRLSTSEIADPHQPGAARRILAATLELLRSSELDVCLLPKDLAKHLVKPDPAARIVSQSGVTGETTATNSSVSAAAAVVFDKVAKAVGKLPDDFAFVL